MTYSGCALCQREAAENAAQDADDERASAPTRDRWPSKPDHRIRSVVRFTLPSNGDRWNWPVDGGDKDSIDALAEILDRAGIAYEVQHG